MATRKRPRTLRPMSEEKILDRLEDASDAVSKVFTGDFRRALSGAVQATDLSSLEVAIRYGDEGLADRAFDWGKLETNVTEALTGDTKTARALLEAADTGVDMASQIARGIGVDFPDGLTDAALESAREKIGKSALKRAKDVTTESRRALGKLVREAFQPNKSIVDIAGALSKSVPASNVSQLMGLNERQAESLGKKIYGWMNDPKVKQSDLQRLIDRERKRMIESRALSIARTDAVAAANRGMLETWKEGKEGPLAGYLKEWVARAKGACPRCGAFDGKQAEMDEEFVSDLGERAMAPEIHSGGYCGMRLVPKS
jgi:hypothetical protein